MALARFKKIRKTTPNATSIIIDDIVNPGYQVVKSTQYTGQVVVLEIRANQAVQQLVSPPGGLHPMGSFANLWRDSFLVVTDTELLVVPLSANTSESPDRAATQRYTIPNPGALIVRIVNDPDNPLVEIMDLSSLPA